MPERVALIIPALNEEETIGLTLDGLRGQPLAQIIVADNGSTDRTAQAARAHGAQVVQEPRRGYGQACLAGIAALEAGISIVVFMDGDASDDPADLPHLLAPIERSEADLVIGSRVRGRCEPGALTPQQRFGNRVFTFLLRILFGARATDLGPFRAIRRAALDQLGMADTNYGWTIEMQIKAARKGLRVAEIPVNYRKRRGGKAKVAGSLRGSIFAGAKISWIVLRYWLKK